MKTATMEVVCDACKQVIPVKLTDSEALYITIRGQDVGLIKGDFCNWECLSRWVSE